MKQSKKVDNKNYKVENEKTQLMIDQLRKFCDITRREVDLLEDKKKEAETKAYGKMDEIKKSLIEYQKDYKESKLIIFEIAKFFCRTRIGKREKGTKSGNQKSNP
jgi:hypothetical protein